jgi:hypothetical protein
MNPMGPATNKDSAGEDQQQFMQLTSQKPLTLTIATASFDEISYHIMPNGKSSPINLFVSA